MMSLRCCALYLGVWVTSLALWPASDAQACSPLRCAPSVFLPAAGSVPSNAVEFLWRPPYDNAQPGTQAPANPLRLFATVNGQRHEIAIDVSDAADGLKRVRATQAVSEGAELVLESSEPKCQFGAAYTPALVTVRAASPKPMQLGSLAVGATHDAQVLNIPTNRGSCTADFKVASTELKLTLDASSQPHADLMRQALLIDGVKRAQRAEPDANGVYPLATKLEDIVYTLCDMPSDPWTRDLTPGSHRIQWLATLPDGSELRSNEITVDLRCGRMSADAGSTAGAGQESPAPRSDADSVPAVDAGSTASGADAGTGATNTTGTQNSTISDPSSLAESETGEGCSLRGGTREASPWSSLVALGCVLFHRRRALQRKRRVARPRGRQRAALGLQGRPGRLGCHRAAVRGRTRGAALRAPAGAATRPFRRPRCT